MYISLFHWRFLPIINVYNGCQLCVFFCLCFAFDYPHRMDVNFPYFPSHIDSNKRKSRSISASCSNQQQRNDMLMQKEKDLLLLTDPKDLDKLFNRRSYQQKVEQDICFPNNRPSTSSSTLDEKSPILEFPILPPPPAMRHSVSYEGINLSALSLFHDIKPCNNRYSSPSESPLPNVYPLNRQERQLLSLYGDNKQPADHNARSESYLQQEQQDRFMYYHPDTGSIRGRSFADINLPPSMTLETLLTKENFWIDITSPSNEEMKIISKVFHIHPLTAEDIMSHEIREKCDVFRHYMFVCYRAFLHDCEQMLKPVTFYNIVTKKHILTVSFFLVNVYISLSLPPSYTACLYIVPFWSCTACKPCTTTCEAVARLY